MIGGELSKRQKNQSENENWFLYRQATISGTLAKWVVSFNEEEHQFR